MSDQIAVVLARIDQNVIHLKEAIEDQKEALDHHAQEDKKITEQFLRPLWEAYQQDIGAGRSKSIGAAVLDRVATVTLSVVATWAAFKGIPK